MSIRRHTTCAFLVMLSGLSLGCKPEGEAEYPYGVEPRPMTHASVGVVDAQEEKATGGGERQAALTDALKPAKKSEVGDLDEGLASAENPNPASQSEGSAEIAPLDLREANSGGSGGNPSVAPSGAAPTKWREEWVRAIRNGSTSRFFFRNDGTFKRLKEEGGELAARWVGIYEQKEGSLSLLYSATTMKPGSKESVQHGLTKTLSFEFEKGKALLLNGEAFGMAENGTGDSNDG